MPGAGRCEEMQCRWARRDQGDVKDAEAGRRRRSLWARGGSVLHGSARTVSDFEIWMRRPAMPSGLVTLYCAGADGRTACERRGADGSALRRLWLCAQGCGLRAQAAPASVSGGARKGRAPGETRSG